MNVKVLEDIKIQSTSNLSSDEISVLTLLYQPIIGTNAYTLYMTLFNLLSREKLSKKLQLKNILSIINISLVEFNEAKDILGAIGLLNTYYNDTKGFIFDINLPLTANEFLLDGSLGIYLYSEIGEDEFKNLTKHYKLHNAIGKEYDNITNSFDDVFMTDIQGVEVTGNYLSKGKSAFVKFNSGFNFDLFTDGLSKNFFDKNNLTDKFKDTFIKLAFTYNLNEIDMQDVYLGSLNSKGELDYKELPKQARKQYQYNFSKDAPKLVFKHDDVANDALSHVKSSSPAELLQEMSGMPAASIDLETIYKLMTINKLSPELTNTLIYYVLKINDMKMPTYSYFEKVANEWGRVGIKTVEEAVEYIKQNSLKKTEKRNKKSQSRKTKTSKQPDWYKEYKDERKAKDEKIKIEDEEKLKDINLKEVSEMFNKL
ncbi:DnaD domain protein [Mycoplasmatota bacterium WC44]